MTIPPRGRLGVGLLLALASLAMHPTTLQDPHEALKAIDAELVQEGKTLKETLKDAADPESTQAIYDDYLTTVLPEFAERYATIARAEKGTEVGLEAWNKVIGLAGRGMKSPVLGEALRSVASDHLQSPELAGLARTLAFAVPPLEEQEVVSTLRSIGEHSPHREVQAAAFYYLGALLGDSRSVGDPRLEQAKEALGKLSSFDDVEFQEGVSYAEAAGKLLFAVDNLVIGKNCPDFQAVDAEGAGFQLSDYKGKVVLVDFWGFW